MRPGTREFLELDPDEQRKVFDRAFELLRLHPKMSRPEPAVTEALDRVSTFHRKVARESDRAVMIIAAIMVENALEDLLLAALLPARHATKDHLLDRPLGTLAARVEAAYRLGLISEPVRQSLDLIRDIRNWVAHHLSRADFTEVDKAGRVTQLVNWLGIADALSDHGTRHRTAREEFETCVALLLLELGVETMRATRPGTRTDRGRLVGLLAGDRSSLLSFVKSLATALRELEDSPQAEDTDSGPTRPDPERPER